MTSQASDMTMAQRRARCPRCGYDQRGVIVTWTESCPLDGVCTECGLALRWAHVFDPQAYLPRWCVEFGHRWWAWPLRVVGTIALTCAPWMFWRSLELSQPLRWRRLAGYVLLLAIIGAASIGGTQALRAGQWWDERLSWTGMQMTIEKPYFMLYCAVLPLSTTPPGTYSTLPNPGPTDLPRPMRYYIQDWRWRLDDWRSALWFHALCAASFALLPVSLKRARVRWAHVVRIAVYGLPLLLPPILLWAASIGIRIEIMSTPGASRAWQDVAEWSGWAGRRWLTALPVFEFVWWSVAASRYLRLPHAWGIGLALAIIAWLITFLIEVVAPIWPLL